MTSIWRSDFPMTTSPLRFFLFASRPRWRMAVLAIVGASIGNIFSATVSYAFKLIANAAAALPQPGSYEHLLWACGLYIVLLALAKVFWRASGFAGAAWAMSALATARHTLTAYVTLHSRAYFSDRFAGSLANKIGHAARGMRDMVDKLLWEFLELAVTAAASFVIAFTASPLIASIFLAWVVLVVILNAYFARRRIPYSTRAHKLETALTGETVDLLSNISAMQEYARRGHEIERLRGSIDVRRAAGLVNWHLGEWMRIMNSILLLFFGGAMVLTTVYLARAGAVSLGDVILVLTIIFRIEGLLQSIGSQINQFGEIWGEIKESLEEILIPHEIPDRPDARELVVSKGVIDFKGITFRYAEGAVFEDLSIHIPEGQRVGLVGRSGAGKTTLIRLLLRHYDLDEGTIAIDSTDITSVTQESLHRAMAVVPQEPLLFHRSVRENIAYGKEGATEIDIIKAARLAQAHDFITRLPRGYDSLVGERGVKLSGGERQRVAIARAILKNAPILLLDEATSSLDSESEVAIQKALHELMQGKTVIAIAHRLSTLREMDRILVLDEGRIVQDGTHTELLKAEGIYADLWNHQAGGFIRDEEES